MVHLKVTHAFVVAAVEVFSGGHAGLNSGLGKSIQHVPAQALAFYPPFTTGAVVLHELPPQAGGVIRGAVHSAWVRAALVAEQFSAVPGVGAQVVVFVQLEIGQALRPAPTVVASKLGPLVVVAGLAPHVNHAVDAGAPAQHLAAGVAQLAAVEARFGLGLVKPVGAGVAYAIEVAHRNMHPVVVIAPPRLNQQDPLAGVHAEPVGQQSTGRARADNDVVKGGVAHLDVGMANSAPLPMLSGQRCMMDFCLV